MHYTIDLEQSLRCFVVTVSGPVSVPGLRAMIDDILKDGRWYEGVSLVVDYRLADLSNLTTDSVTGIVEYIMTITKKSDVNRIAHIVSRTVDFGMIRMWEIMMSERAPFDFRVFYSMDEALAWIGSA